jgi:transposase-like protein
VDHTEIKVSGKTCYFYRCFDKGGNLVDVMLSDDKSEETAERFFDQCHDTAGFEPEMITTDNEASLAAAITLVFGNRVEHRKSKYMNNRLEQDHRAPKSRYRPMKGFGDEFSAQCFLHSFEEIIVSAIHF